MRSVSLNRGDSLLFREINLSQELSYADLKPLSDIHWEDRLCNTDALHDWRKWILASEDRFWYGGGDLFNVATRDSVTGIFGQRMTLDQAIDEAVEFLEPVADRCWGLLSGNHCQRIEKHAGMNPAYRLSRELGLAYDENGLFFKIRLGTKKRNGKPQVYTAYATHGHGGGRKIGGKANKLEDMGGMILADIYMVSHTHVKLAFKDNFIVPDLYNNNIRFIERTYVNTSALLGWGGYSERGGYRPSAQGSPCVRLYGSDNKEIRVIL